MNNNFNPSNDDGDGDDDDNVEDNSNSETIEGNHLGVNPINKQRN